MMNQMDTQEPRVQLSTETRNEQTSEHGVDQQSETTQSPPEPTRIPPESNSRKRPREYERHMLCEVYKSARLNEQNFYFKDAEHKFHQDKANQGRAVQIIAGGANMPKILQNLKNPQNFNAFKLFSAFSGSVWGAGGMHLRPWSLG